MIKLILFVYGPLQLGLVIAVLILSLNSGEYQYILKVMPYFISNSMVYFCIKSILNDNNKMMKELFRNDN